MEKIRRIYVEKKADFDIASKHTLKEIVNALKINATDVRTFIRYDISGVADANFDSVCQQVFLQPQTDVLYHEQLPSLKGYSVFGVEYLSGQYNQRADSAEQAIKFLLNGDQPIVKTATVYAVSGVTEKEMQVIKDYFINTTDSKLAEMQKPSTLAYHSADDNEIEYIDGFISMNNDKLQQYYDSQGFAMTFADIAFVQQHFIKINRNPTVTELKVIDTYWSDHCRHTTFLTELKDIEIGNNLDVMAGYKLYKKIFDDIYKDRQDKYVCLMDIATIGAKAIKKMGKLDDLDISDEINACSIKVKVDVDGKEEDWLVMFKNETHNHPTEMEPFGGASTCLGGAIRDPLSGRVYVYQAMRVSGAANILQPVDRTLDGKLPQRVISKTAAAGYSSYGNQIGLATGLVNEIYHDNYVAKRMEAGFVIGAAPAENIRREKPMSGDKIILLGGETGRDGCGGATGSSKAHSIDSANICGAEVQKGNPILERKIQRLFRNKNATSLIKKCNDFGAGGVSVAIGELADGLDIYLDKVPTKYSGLNVTEIAISESQERMAVVVSACDSDAFLAYAKQENLMATVVAEVTNKNRMRMFNNGQTVVDLDRAFLDTNGVKQTASVKVREMPSDKLFFTYDDKVELALSNKDYSQAVKLILQDKNVMLQKGQTEMFDATAGGLSVLVPFGGKYQLSPSINMCAKLPVQNGNTNTASICSWAFNPSITDKNPYLGSLYAVIASVSKLVAGGADYSKIRLTFQEYFKRLDGDSVRFGEPFSALLGALYAQIGLGIPSIGGKDSMSGSFEDIDVPNTLISFAVGILPADKVITNVFESGQQIYHIPLVTDGMPDFEYIKKVYSLVNREILSSNIKSATVVENGGVISAIIKSLVGNKLGMDISYIDRDMFDTRLGDLIVAVENIDALKDINYRHIGTVNNSGVISAKDLSLSIDDAIKHLSGFETIYPTAHDCQGDAKSVSSDKPFMPSSNRLIIAKPRVLIPIFPGTSGEYETAKLFEQRGAIAETLIIKNANEYEIIESINKLSVAIKNSQILALASGAVGGDEPDGSAKFITTLFSHAKIAEEIMRLLTDRDGLILGIASGFQALIKLGLLPYGKITKTNSNAITTVNNKLNRVVSTMVNTRVTTNASPWLSSFNVGDIFTAPVGHIESRFYASDDELQKLISNGNIASQYVDLLGNATMDSSYNPSGSTYAIESLINADGKILGKMSHVERYQKDLYKNIDGNFDMDIFTNGIKYYS